MFENILSIGHINFFLVFIEGIISFFSPCVIPLIPIYMSYLAGNAKKKILMEILHTKEARYYSTHCSLCLGYPLHFLF